MIVKDPEGVETEVPMCKRLVTPVPVGVTGLVSKPHVIPVGNGITQDKVTGCVLPAVNFTVIVTGVEPPC